MVCVSTDYDCEEIQKLRKHQRRLQKWKEVDKILDHNVHRMRNSAERSRTKRSYLLCRIPTDLLTHDSISRSSVVHKITEGRWDPSFSSSYPILMLSMMTAFLRS
ncbi:unnamed protein product [Amoebophrya sp. A25]|nr:unnamed protein product [Amoebophrya sp. A25]|eukprot:GSA25T00007178001.1